METLDRCEGPVMAEATGWSEFDNNGGAGGFRRGYAGEGQKNEGLWS